MKVVLLPVFATCPRPPLLFEPRWASSWLSVASCGIMESYRPCVRGLSGIEFNHGGIQIELLRVLSHSLSERAFLLKWQALCC